MVEKIVIDNSVLVPLFFPDEQAEFSDRVLRRVHDGVHLIAPRLALIEFGNVVLRGVRQKRISQSVGDAALSDFMQLPVQFIDSFAETQLSRVMRLAQRRGLTAYDATYLALAIDEGAALASLDSALRVAAEAERVEFLK